MASGNNRDFRRHTRRNPAGPVWQGIESNSKDEIARRGLIPTTTRSDILWSITVPPPPPMRPSRPRQPRRPPPMPVLGPIASRSGPLDEIFGSGDIARVLFSHIGRGTYDNLRLVNRQLADLLPHASGINGITHAEISYLPQQCGDTGKYGPEHLRHRQRVGFHRAWLRADAVPRKIPHNPWHLYRPCGRVGRVPRLLANHPPPATAVAPCQGALMGVNSASDQRHAHQDPKYL
jgi:hypothetical protein